MAVASLRYRPNAALADESKAGFVYFSGVPREYHYWHFRTMLKFETPVSSGAADADCSGSGRDTADCPGSGAPRK